MGISRKSSSLSGSGCGIRRLRPAITPLSFDAFQIDAVQDHGQIGRANLDAAISACRLWKAEAALFQAFVPDRQTIGIPIEQFDAVATFVSKNEQVPRQGVAAKEGANHVGQAVKTF